MNYSVNKEYKMNYSVTKNGKPLDESLYTLDDKTKVFYTNENDLVLDFSSIKGVSFNTGNNCTFTTGSNCTFKTSYNCNFNTGSNCTFNTDYYCTFTTGSYCTFNTGYECTFTTGYNCTFTTGSDGTFKTGTHCTFTTDSSCIFNTYTTCTVTLTDTLVVMIRSSTETKVYNINDYYRPALEGFQVTEVDLDRLKDFPLDEPRLVMLHKYDDLGKRLFEHYQKKGLL